MDRLLESVASAQRRLGEAGIDSVVIGGVAVAAWGQGSHLDTNYVVNWLQRFEQMIDDATLVETFRRYLS